MTQSSRVSGRIARFAIVTALVLVFVLLTGVSAAFAAECVACHYPGGPAPSGAAHALPTPPTWDSRLGQCTICHEVPTAIKSGYQNPPHGANPMPDIPQHRMQFTGMLASSMVCFWCHDGSSGPVAHGYIVGPGDSYLPIAKTGTIDVAGSDCAGCHTSGMSSPSDPLAPADVPQVDPVTHSDPGAVHDAIEDDPTCVAACHPNRPAFSDPTFLGKHGSNCSWCHNAQSTINPALDYSCGSCHTSSTTPWSLILGALVALGTLLVPAAGRPFTG